MGRNANVGCVQGAVVRQAEDRAHRQGQRLPVNVYFLCARGTSDDRRCAHAVRLEKVHFRSGASGGSI